MFTKYSINYGEEDPKNYEIPVYKPIPPGYPQKIQPQGIKDVEKADINESFDNTLASELAHLPQASDNVINGTNHGPIPIESLNEFYLGPRGGLRVTIT